MAQIPHAARRYGYKIKHRFRQDPFSAIILYAVLLGLFFTLFAFRGMIATLFIKPLGIINPGSQSQSNVNTPETNSTTDNSFGLKSTGIYTVKEGDTLASIAAVLKIPWQDIADLNNLKAPYSLTVGQELKLPTKE